MKVNITSQRTRILATGVILIIAFGLGRYTAPRSDDHDHDHTDTEETTNGEPQIYTCSMHPQVRTPDPNEKCPICAMDLIPVPSDDDDADDTDDVPRLRLSRRAVALLQIQTRPAARKDVAIPLSLFGKVSPDESRNFRIAARTDAYVETLYANTPWQRVQQGETIAELYSPAAVTAMRELQVARDASETMREAARSRLKRMGLDEAQIDEIEQASDTPRTFRVVSPHAGFVRAAPVREGDWLREGMPLIELLDLSKVWVNVEAYERDIPWIQQDQPVSFALQAWPGKTFDGIVTFIEPNVDGRSRTIRLRVEAENPDGILKPGMFVSATVQTNHQPSTINHLPLPLVVPVSAPLVMGRRAIVYVQIPDTERPTFEPRHVTLGPRTKDFWIIESGLQEGDLVVVNGQFKIDSELQIRGRPSMMAPAGEDATTHADHATTDGKSLQTDCPVMGGAINRDHFVDVEGYRIYVCCPGCDETILEDPQRYIDEMKATGIQLYRLQTHCPIMDFPINRDLYHDHDGQRIYICCPGCMDEVKERADEIIAEQRAKGIVFEVTP